MAKPLFIVMAGPNGAGKSTCASQYLVEGMTYVNADEIAKTLPGSPSAGADFQAGRVALEMMDGFEAAGESFATETTLASRSLAGRIIHLRRVGYEVRLVFVWSPSAEFSVRRVASRVQSGGHHIPEETIRRRYTAGIANFFQLYQPIVDAWDLLENLTVQGPRLIASGRLGHDDNVHLPELWDSIRRSANQ